MLHIFKNKGEKTYDFAVVRSGRTIFRTVQGYENKGDVYSTIVEDLQEVGNPNITNPNNFRIIQDDTARRSNVVKVWSNGNRQILNKKPNKRFKA